MKKILIIIAIMSSFMFADECLEIHSKIQNIKKSIKVMSKKKEETRSEWVKKFYSWTIEKYNGAIEILEKEKEECKV